MPLWTELVCCFKRFSTLVLIASVSTLLLCAAEASADVSLPKIFSSNMVLQRDQPIPVWGWATAGEEVTVSLGENIATTTADAEGNWSVKLKKMEAGGPYDVVVSGKNKLELADVLIGEVWVCSGQSNMAWTVSRSNDAKEEISAANYPQIRLFTVAHKPQMEEQKDCNGTWTKCSPQTIAGFSAVAYFFGRSLYKELNVPIGLINTSWGGTRCEAWTPDNDLQANKDFAPILQRSKAAKFNHHSPSALFNGMIAPLVPYGIRGAIWYQGEANRGRAYQYRTLFPTMITAWRQRWGQGDFPFLFVQLAPYRYGGNPTNLPELQEAQTMTLKLPNTGMAVTNDIGNIKDIHPRNKQDVGSRLALWALAKTYGKKDLVHSGPLYRGFDVEGNKIRIKFDHVGGGLLARDEKGLSDFTIAGEDKEFVPAEAKIEGNTVVVSSDKVEKPVAVRFAWNHTALPNLMNKEGLPASSFRTDDWEGSTYNSK